MEIEDDEMMKQICKLLTGCRETEAFDELVKSNAAMERAAKTIDNLNKESDYLKKELEDQCNLMIKVDEDYVKVVAQHLSTINLQKDLISKLKAQLNKKDKKKKNKETLKRVKDFYHNVAPVMRDEFRERNDK